MLNIVAITTMYMNQCLAQLENNEQCTQKYYFLFKKLLNKCIDYFMAQYGTPQKHVATLGAVE